MLGVPCISYIKAVDIDESVTLTRQTSTGSEKVVMPANCVLSVTAGGVEPRYPNFKDIMAAKSKPIERISIADINYDTQQNLEFVDIKDVSTTKQGEKIIDEGEGFQIIIDKLKELKAI